MKLSNARRLDSREKAALRRANCKNNGMSVHAIDHTSCDHCSIGPNTTWDKYINTTDYIMCERCGTIYGKKRIGESSTELFSAIDKITDYINTMKASPFFNNAEEDNEKAIMYDSIVRLLDQFDELEEIWMKINIEFAIAHQTEESTEPVKEGVQDATEATTELAHCQNDDGIAVGDCISDKYVSPPPFFGESFFNTTELRDIIEK